MIISSYYDNGYQKFADCFSNLKSMFILSRNQPIKLNLKSTDWFLSNGNIDLNPFQSSVAFHIETSH